MSTFTKGKVKKQTSYAVIDIQSISRKVFSTIKYEKSFGIKRGWFFTDISKQETRILDTLDEFNLLVSGYESQGLYRYKTISASSNDLQKIGAKSADIIVFRTIDGTIAWDYDFPDFYALGFGYFGLETELVIVDIKF
jgi:hypothetical protein